MGFPRDYEIRLSLECQLRADITEHPKDTSGALFSDSPVVLQLSVRPQYAIEVVNEEVSARQMPNQAAARVETFGQRSQVRHGPYTSCRGQDSCYRPQNAPDRMTGDVFQRPASFIGRHRIRLRPLEIYSPSSTTPQIRALQFPLSLCIISLAVSFSYDTIYDRCLYRHGGSAAG